MQRLKLEAVLQEIRSLVNIFTFIQANPSVIFKRPPDSILPMQELMHFFPPLMSYSVLQRLLRILLKLQNRRTGAPSLGASGHSRPWGTMVNETIRNSRQR